MKSERLNAKVLTAIAHLVNDAPDQRMQFKDIHAGLVAHGLTTESNERKTALYLKRLCEKGILEKVGPRGPYALKTNVKDYETFAYLEYLNDLYASRGLTHRFGVGGMFWRESEGMVIPFAGKPNKLDGLLLNELETLLSGVSHAIKELRDRILLLDAGYDAGYSQETMRQGLLAMVWNVMGRADIGNGDVQKILQRLTKIEPSKEETNYQITEKYMLKSVQIRLDTWKRAFYDMHGESSVEHSAEDIWLSTLRMQGETWETVGPMIAEEKQRLKRSGLDVDHTTSTELKKRKKAFDDSIHAKVVEPKDRKFGFASYTLTPEESQLSHDLDSAIGIKYVEAFLKMGADYEDFAVVLTTPPQIMSRYNTPLHRLKEDVALWKDKTPIDDELLRYFACQLLHFDLAPLRRIGVGALVGLSDDQVDRIVDHWRQLRQQWAEEHDEPVVGLSKEREKLILDRLEELDKDEPSDTG